ncbi:MAG: ABC transporter substrate-binding protein [Polyangiaceae bacterium]|nr:ABC transporter substrate-binding protein [Polyangiaceae bacterium]
MKNQFLRKFSLLFCLASLFCSSAVFAASGAEGFLKTQQDKLTKIIAQPSSAANDSKLQSAFDALLDYETLSKDSLGSEWAKLTPEQQKKFGGLLKTLVQRSYTKNIRNTLDYNIHFEGEDSAKNGQLVKTVARHKSDKRKEPIHINYVVHQTNGKWLVTDIVTEGSSLVKNYRSQFRRLIRKKGFDGLMERMQKKVDEGGV